MRKILFRGKCAHSDAWVYGSFVDYERLHKAYKLFMDSGHSGCYAHLTANMIKRFCPDGADVADAVMNFRFDKKD
jgi:hypothetical protein